jgi:cytochrome c
MPALVLGTWAIAAHDVPAAQSGKRTVWDGVYTEAQATRGKAGYEEQCSFCHLADLSGEGFAPALIEDTFRGRWQDGNLADLFIIVKQTMPQDKPASLTDQEYAEIVAYLLKSNKYPAGEQPLEPNPAALKEVGFKRDGGAKP